VLMWLMLLIVQIFKVHPGFSVTDVNGCIDAVGAPWCCVAHVTGCIDGVITPWYIGIPDVIGCIDGKGTPWCWCH